MAVSEADLDDIFQYHPPDEDQILRLATVRAAAREFAWAILQQTPVCPDQTVAIRKVREAVMTANAAIALRGKY